MGIKLILTWAPVVLGAVVNAQVQPGDTGTLSTLMGGLKGDVVVKSSSEIDVNNFELMSTGGAPLWWYGSKGNTIANGFRVSNTPIKKAQNSPTEVTVHLNAGKTLEDFAYFGLWCEAFSINFGQTKLVAGNSSSSSASSTTSASTTSAGSASASATSQAAGAALGVNSLFVPAVGLAISAVLA